jgi:hypothetical protein
MCAADGILRDFTLHLGEKSEMRRTAFGIPCGATSGMATPERRGTFENMLTIY